MEKFLRGNWDGSIRRLRSLGVVITDENMDPLPADNDSAGLSWVWLPEGSTLTSSRNVVFFQGKTENLRAIHPEEGPFTTPEPGFIFIIP